MIELNDLKAQQKYLPNLQSHIEKVLAHGQFINGPEVVLLEEALAKFANVNYAISCASGTDAIILILKAMGIQPNDVIFVPAFSFIASAEAVARVGAIPYFVDVEADTFNISLASLSAGLQEARRQKLSVRGVLSVDLFGQPIDYVEMEAFCQSADLSLLVDAAQSFGGRFQDKSVGQWGLATATSFFPTKPLGCYGDGGAVLTNDESLYSMIKTLKFHGQTRTYHSEFIGMNSRLDTIQAAILLEKLDVFPQELARRDEIAKLYTEALGERVRCPKIMPQAKTAWAQYTIQVPADKREAIIEGLLSAGVRSRVYYPRALHQQPAFADYPQAPSLNQATRLADTVLSLPMHPYLSDSDIAQVITAVQDVC